MVEHHILERMVRDIRQLLLPEGENEEEEETIYLWDNQLEKIAHGRNYHYKEKKEGAEISSSSQ